MALIVLVVVPTTNGSAHGPDPYQDCGLYNDTSYYNRHEMWSGESCHGNLNYDNSDYYFFHPTLDDYITVTFTQRSECIFGHVFGPSGDKDADTGGFDGGGRENGWTTSRSILGEGTMSHTIYIHKSDFFPDYDTCKYAYGYEYTIRLDIIPNDRPTISILSSPSYIEPGQNVSLTIRADDPNSNLSRIGMQVGSVTPTWQSAPGSTGTKTFTTSFLENTTVKFLGEDVYGATASASFNVSLSQNDCGTGSDANNVLVSFPKSCRGYLSKNPLDNSDSYRFSVPNSVGRVRAGYSRAAGDLSTRVSLVSPAGVTHTATDAPVFADALPGVWRVYLDRLSGSGLYDLALAQVAAAAPPNVSMSVSSTSIHQGDNLTLNVSATDPNNERLRFNINWGDGTSQQHPTGSGSLTSPAGFSLQHRYTANTTSSVITVTATNEENLSSIATSPSISIAPHNDCGFGPGYEAGATYDASTSRELPASCSGELGYFLADGSVDLADAFKVTMNQFVHLRIELLTSGSLNARLYVFYIGAEVQAVPAGILGQGQVFDLPVGVPGTYRVFVRRSSGVGSYSLQVTKG